MSLSVPIPVPARVLRLLTSHGDGWLASPGATAQPLGMACVCQARPQLHFHLSTMVSGFPWPGKGCFESLANRSPRKASPSLSQAARAGWRLSPHGVGKQWGGLLGRTADPTLGSGWSLPSSQRGPQLAWATSLLAAFHRSGLPGPGRVMANHPSVQTGPGRRVGSAPFCCLSEMWKQERRFLS